MRDLDIKPYSADEQRIAEWFFEKGLGGGDDPVGSLIASHEAMAFQRNEARAEIERLKDEAAINETVIHGLRANRDDAEAEIDRLKSERDSLKKALISLSLSWSGTTHDQ